MNEYELPNDHGEKWEFEEPTRRYDLEDRLVAFSAQIIDVVEALPNTRAGNHLAGQLIRSGTSTALNYGEVQAAESRNDFIHKMKIGWKELKETRVCLRIIDRKKMVADHALLESTLNETQQLVSIFAKSISTAQANRNSSSTP